MAFRTPRDEREWRAMVERSIRESRQGIRPIVDAAVGGAIGGIVDQIEQGSTKHPTAPIELTYQTALYIDSDGRYRARFMLDFPDVTKATDATDIVVEQYELWGKRTSAPLLLQTTDAVPGLAAPGATLPGLAATPSNKAIAAIDAPWELMSTNTESFFRADGFIPGTIWDFRARAIGRGMSIPGNWSAEITVQMVEDSTAPSQPTPPILTVSRGTITATWDGLAVTGAMPADFRYVILAHGTDTSPTFEIARFGRGGGFKVVADIPYFDPQFFRLKAVDESGNESPWSEQSVAYTTPLVDKDVILSTIDAAKTHLKNINAGVSILPNTIITEHLVVTEEMTAAIANFLHIRTDMLDANQIWADELWVGIADAILVRSDMFEGKSFTGGTFTGMLFQTNIEALTGLKIDESGLASWNAGGEQTLNIDAFTGNVDILGTFQVGRDDEPFVLLTKDAWGVWPGIRFKVEDPELAYQPTVFAVGTETPLSNLELGDMMVMGGQDVANASPRAELKLGNRGREAHLGRYWTDNGISNQIRFEEDGGTAIYGYLKTSNTGSTFQWRTTGQSQSAAGYWTITVTPPVSGLYMPMVTADGATAVQSATSNIVPSGYLIHWNGPANNSTSFMALHVWRP